MQEEQATPLSRRDAIKKAAAGAGAAGLVWSAPRIEGLSLRPGYAAAMSTGTELLPVSANAGEPPTISSVACASGTLRVEFSLSSMGPFDGFGIFASVNLLPPGTGVITDLALITGMLQSPVLIRNASSAFFSGRAADSAALLEVRYNCA